MRPRVEIAMFWIPCTDMIGSSGNGEGGNGGNSSLSISGLDKGGVAGNGPKNCCDKSISFALSDLWTPDRKPSGRVGLAAGTCAIWISPRNSILMLFSICRSGAALVPSLSSSSSSIGGANSRLGVEADSPKTSKTSLKQSEKFSSCIIEIGENGFDFNPSFGSLEHRQRGKTFTRDIFR